MQLARLWTAFAVALSPVLGWAQAAGGAPARGAESAFSWFTVLAVVAVIAVIFGFFSDARRGRRPMPR